jgi:hypothetical protein
MVREKEREEGCGGKAVGVRWEGRRSGSNATTKGEG